MRRCSPSEPRSLLEHLIVLKPAYTDDDDGDWRHGRRQTTSCDMPFGFRYAWGHRFGDVRQANQYAPRATEGTISVYVGVHFCIILGQCFVILGSCWSPIDTGIFFVSHDCPMRPPEQPGVPFGEIVGIILGSLFLLLSAQT